LAAGARTCANASTAWGGVAELCNLLFTPTISGDEKLEIQKHYALSCPILDRQFFFTV
jgi:hypothetical protein